MKNIYIVSEALTNYSDLNNNNRSGSYIFTGWRAETTHSRISILSKYIFVYVMWNCSIFCSAVLIPINEKKWSVSFFCCMLDTWHLTEQIKNYLLLSCFVFLSTCLPHSFLLLTFNLFSFISIDKVNVSEIQTEGYCKLYMYNNILWKEYSSGE